MVEREGKCPQCGLGLMQPVLETTEITSEAIKTSLRTRCARCGYERDAKMPPDD